MAALKLGQVIRYGIIDMNAALLGSTVVASVAYRWTDLKALTA